MKFDRNDYPAIKQACTEKQDVEFEIDKSITAFSGSDAPPADWTEYPPSHLSDSDLAKVMAYLAIDPSPRSAFHRLEQVVHLQGAKVFYKKGDDQTVAVKVQW